MSNKELAFLLGRLSLGINFAAHGLIRLPKLSAFSAGMVKKFQDTIIGIDPFISAFAHVLVFAELAIGVFLLIGFKTRPMLASVSILMMILIFGSSMEENWDLVASQMIYVIFAFLMISGFTETRYSVDHLMKKSS